MDQRAILDYSEQCDLSSSLLLFMRCYRSVVSEYAILYIKDPETPEEKAIKEAREGGWRALVRNLSSCVYEMK